MSESSSEPPVRIVKPRPFADVPWKIRDVVWFVCLWMGSQVAIVAALFLLKPILPGPAVYLMSAADGSNLDGSFVLALANALIGFGLLGWLMRKYQVGWSAVGWRRVNIFKAVGVVLLILVGFIVAAQILLTVISALVPSFNPNQAQTNEFTGASSGMARNIAFVALVLLPPILEETIFRGFLFPAVAKRLGTFGGVVVSSLLFALAHGQANIGVYTFLLGVVLCVMYLRFKSIVPGIILHMANNYLAFWAMTQN